MTILKYFGTHFGDLGHYLLDHIEESPGRIKFVTNTGSVLCHKALIFQNFPALVELFCGECDSKHEDSTVIASEVDIDYLREAIETFYNSGNTELLNILFLEMFATGQTRKVDTLENIFNVKSDVETRLEEKSCKEVDVVKQALLMDSTAKKVLKRKRRLKMKGYKNVKFLPTNFDPKPLADGRTSYLCNKCGKGCTNMSGAARHSFFCSAKTIGPKYVNSFPCDFCGSIYKRKKWLKAHIKTHTEAREVKDESSRKDVLYPFDLPVDKEAIEMVSDAKDEGKMAPNNDFISRHLENGKLVYQCRKCFKSCTNISGASRHSAFCKKSSYRAGTSNPLPCELCNKVCLTRGGLNMHMKQVHTEK